METGTTSSSRVDGELSGPRCFGLDAFDWLHGAFVLALLLAGASALRAWFALAPAFPILPRAPIPENQRAISERKETANLEGTLATFAGRPSAVAALWQGFRGGDHDNVSRDRTPLVDSFGGTSPPVLWSVPLGEGYAGPAVANGCVYVLDYDQVHQQDALRCFSLDDGREIWRRSYPVKIKRNHGFSRTVPAVSDRFVVSLGPKCHVLCAEARTGGFLWGLDLVAEQGTKVPLWYTGQCPLIDDGVAVFAPAGRALLLGVDCATGKTVWETPNPRGFRMSHASVVPMTLCGRRMYVYPALGGMVGVAADGPDRGRILWETTDWNHAVISPSPVRVGDDQVMVSAGYGNGSALFRIRAEGGAFRAEKVATWSKEVFACEQHTPIWFAGHLFTVMPNDAGELNRQLVCLKPDGTRAWASGSEDRFGLGPFLIAGDRLFVLADDGTLTMVAARTDRYERLDRARVLEGPEAWAPLAMVEGRLLVRDLRRLACLDLRRATP